ncbi:hypothetical protein ACHAWC_001538, partial [Mediolabrus comicus]
MRRGEGSLGGGNGEDASDDVEDVIVDIFDESDVAKHRNAANKAANAPKHMKPMNGYMRFTAEISHEVIAEFPELNGKELSVKFQERWQALDEDKKKKYCDDAKEEMEKFNEQYGEDSLKPKKKKARTATVYVHEGVGKEPSSILTLKRRQKKEGAKETSTSGEKRKELSSLAEKEP